MSHEVTVNIAGIDKAELLSALYNRSRQQGMGFMHARGAHPMTVEQAREEIAAHGLYFDYLHGRVMKVDLSGGELFTYAYNRDVGRDAAEEVIALLRDKQEAA